MRARLISAAGAGALFRVMLTGGPLAFTNPELRSTMVPTAMSPSGGATARGCSGGTDSG